jgi:hypothetical protein
MLAAQVTNLARLGLAGIADRHLTALVRVKVSASASAVAIAGDRLLVDVVHEWAALCWQTRNGDGELNTSAIAS